MEIRKFAIGDNPAFEQRPFIKIGRGEGCGLSYCGCSEGWWISMSNGETGLYAKFSSEKEYERFLANGQLFAEPPTTS